MRDELFQRLRLVADDGVTETGVARGDRHDAALQLAELLQERRLHLAKEDDALQRVAGVEELAETVAIQRVLRTEEDRGESALGQRAVQAVEDVAEIGAVVGDVESRPEHEAHLAQPRLARGLLEFHPLRLVAQADGVVPDALVGLGADAVLAAVQGERDEGLGDAEVGGDLLLRDLLAGGHGKKV